MELKLNTSIIKILLVISIIILLILSIANSSLAIEYYNLQDTNKKNNIFHMYVMAIMNIAFSIISVSAFIISLFILKIKPSSNVNKIIYFIIILLGTFSSSINYLILNYIHSECNKENNKSILTDITYFIYIPFCILFLILFYLYNNKDLYDTKPSLSSQTSEDTLASAAPIQKALEAEAPTKKASSKSEPQVREPPVKASSKSEPQVRKPPVLFSTTSETLASTQAPEPAQALAPAAPTPAPASAPVPVPASAPAPVSAASTSVLETASVSTLTPETLGQSSATSVQSSSTSETLVQAPAKTQAQVSANTQALVSANTPAPVSTKIQTQVPVPV